MSDIEIVNANLALSANLNELSSSLVSIVSKANEIWEEASASQSIPQLELAKLRVLSEMKTRIETLIKGELAMTTALLEEVRNLLS